MPPAPSEMLVPMMVLRIEDVEGALVHQRAVAEELEEGRALAAAAQHRAEDVGVRDPVRGVVRRALDAAAERRPEQPGQRAPGHAERDDVRLRLRRRRGGAAEAAAGAVAE